MSEVNGRATPAHRRQRSRHTHAHATRRAPSAPPQRPRPHPRTRTHALAPTLRNLMLRAAAALHANTTHNPHPTTLTGQHRMLRARMTPTTATATATHTARDPPRRDRHSQPPSIHATIHAHLIPTDALLGGCFGIYPAQSNTVKHSKAFARTRNMKSLTDLRDPSLHRRANQHPQQHPKHVQHPAQDHYSALLDVHSRVSSLIHSTYSK